MQDARNFSYSSDYPMPIVTYRKEFTLTAPQGDGGITLIKIAHGLPYVPLTLGKWSATQDFTTAQDISSTSHIDGSWIVLMADETYLYFIIYNLRDESSITRYVRVIGFAPPDYNGDIQPVENDSSFRFDSDNDYLSVYKQGVLDHSTGGLVEHSLGYAPQCKAWMLMTFESTTPDINVTGYKLLDPDIWYAYNTGRLSYDSIATNTSFIAYGKDINNNDYSLSEGAKIYYHIYTKEA